MKQAGKESTHREYRYSDRVIKAKKIYQIGEPIVPGKDFFKMVEHYLRLQKWIETHIDNNLAIVKKVEEHGESAYLKPLFKAILLDYFDRFGIIESDADAAIKKLCKWAYMVRLDLDYLGPKTPNRYALGAYGTQSKYSNNIPMFAKVKTAVEHTEVIDIHLTQSPPPTEGDKYHELRESLDKLGND